MKGVFKDQATGELWIPRPMARRAAGGITDMALERLAQRRIVRERKEGSTTLYNVQDLQRSTKRDA